MEFNLSFDLDSITSDSGHLNTDTLYDILIIGAGPAGLNAALYAVRKGLNIAVLGKKKGGQILNTSCVDNYLGSAEITGEQLAHNFLGHLKKYPIPILEEAEVIDYYVLENVHHIVLSSGATYRSKTAIIATGSTPRQLGVTGEKFYAGKGVSYCAICDAPLFTGKDVLVAGGGNGAVEAALDLAKAANSVKLVHRSKLRADKILVEKLLKHPRITVYLHTRILEIIGEEGMNGIKAEDLTNGEQQDIKGDGLFVEIGHIPNTGPFAKHISLNERGEIITSARMETKIPGLFAAGDVTGSPFKQIIIAASDGAIAALAANDYINQTQLK